MEQLLDALSELNKALDPSAATLQHVKEAKRFVNEALGVLARKDEDDHTRTLALSDVQAIADAVTLQMLTLPQELAAFIEPQRTLYVNLAPIESRGGIDNVALCILTDSDGMWLDFTARGQQRIAILRFNYRGWAWHRFDVARCPLCGQDHRRK